MTAIKGLNHIGVAVDDVARVADVLAKVLRASRSDAIHLASEGIDVVSVRAGDTHIELFEPQVEGSVRRFIDKRGNAMHHICLEVDDLQAELDRLRGEGVRLIDETPRDGAFDQRVAFIHPKETGGILIELAQSGA